MRQIFSIATAGISGERLTIIRAMTSQASRMRFVRQLTNMTLFAAMLCLSPAIRADQELTRVTMNVDVRDVGTVLRQVSKLFDGGFGRHQADELASTIDKLKADQPQVWQYEVVWQGAAYPLRIRALVDDLGNVDLDFSTPSSLAAKIRQGVDTPRNSRRR